MRTTTGSYPIGFRRSDVAWQKDIPSLCRWAKQQGFDAIDLNEATPDELSAVAAGGLQLGSVDLLDFGNITHPDTGRRRAIVARNVEYVRRLAAAGAKIFFTIVGADPNKKRAENYRIAVEAFAPIAEAAAAGGARLAIEGYPGGAPHYALLCSTPETCRMFLRDLPAGVALNYDPSHLIRLGVDHIRFLREFAPHVAHVHGKDTEVFPEAVYELGLFQESVNTPAHGWGAYTWRYALPGLGNAQWTNILSVLRDAGYRGVVSVELEDERYNGTEAGEREGLVQSLQFLSRT